MKDVKKAKKVKILVSLPEYIVRRIDVIAARRGMRRSTLIQIILEDYLKKIENEGKLT